MKRALLNLLLLVCIAVNASAAPGIEWSAPRLETRVGDGRPVTPPSITFRSATTLHDVTVWVAPALQQYLKPSPAELPLVEPGRDYTISFDVSVPPYATPGIRSGTVHLRQNAKTIAKPLPADVEVTYGGNVVASRTRVLDDASLSLLTAVSEDGRTLTFGSSSADLSRLATGDLLVLPPVALLADGFLGNITSIDRTGPGLVLVTTPATLAEAFIDADIALASPIAPDSIAEIAGASIQSKDSSLDDDSWTLRMSDVVLYDADGNRDATKFDQVRATGEVELDTDLNLDLRIRNSAVERASFAANATARGTVSVTAAVFLEPTEPIRFYLYRPVGGGPSLLNQPAIRLRPIIIWAGYVPIVFTPVVNVAIGLDGTVSVGMTSSVTATASAMAGLRYENGTVTPFHDETIDFDYEVPTAVLEANAKAFAGPQLDLLLYGLAGPAVILDAFLEAVIQPALDPWWSLYGGFEARIRLRIPGVIDFNVPVISIRRLLAQADLRACDTTPSGVSNGKVFLTGGSLAGQPLGGGNWEIMVGPGESISGVVQIHTVNTMPRSAVAPFGYTWTWGNRTSALVTVSGWIPTGTATWNIPINLTAPATEGTYYLLFAFQGEFNLGQVMSATNWSAGGAIWNDGNDFFDVPSCLLEHAHSTGFVPSWLLRYPGGVRIAFDSPLTPIRVHVVD